MYNTFELLYIQASGEPRKYHLLGSSYILSLVFTTILQISSPFYRWKNRRSEYLNPSSKTSKSHKQNLNKDLKASVLSTFTFANVWLD